MDFNNSVTGRSDFLMFPKLDTDRGFSGRSVILSDSTVGRRQVLC